MYQGLFHSISQYVSISEEEFEFCKGLFIPKKLRRRQYILQEGDVCKYTVFVEKGLLRSYTVDDKGNEHIFQFALEEGWMADLYSFFTNEPSQYHIDALENCELLLISKPSWDILFEEIPVMERYFRILIQNNLIATQRRLMGALRESAEEKYNKFVSTYPQCLQRVPQHMIASYLGITRETLSRIRGQKSFRNKT